MQPKHLPMYERLKHEPTQKQQGVSCRLYGKDFRSIAEAARYWKISYTWAREQITQHRHRETKPEVQRRNRTNAAYKETDNG